MAFHTHTCFILHTGYQAYTLISSWHPKTCLESLMLTNTLNAHTIAQQMALDDVKRVLQLPKPLPDPHVGHCRRYCHVCLSGMGTPALRGCPQSRPARMQTEGWPSVTCERGRAHSNPTQQVSSAPTSPHLSHATTRHSSKTWACEDTGHADWAQRAKMLPGESHLQSWDGQPPRASPACPLNQARPREGTGGTAPSL